MEGLLTSSTPGSSGGSGSGSGRRKEVVKNRGGLRGYLQRTPEHKVVEKVAKWIKTKYSSVKDALTTTFQVSGGGDGGGGGGGGGSSIRQRGEKPPPACYCQDDFSWAD